MTLKEARERLEEKQKALAAIFEQAKTESGEYDFDRVKSLEGTTTAKLEKVHQMEAELNALYDEAEKMAKAQEGWKRFGERSQEPRPIIIPGSGGPPEAKSLGRLIVESKAYRDYRQFGVPGSSEIPEFGLRELKTLFQTGAGWAPESVRLPGFVEAVTRPIQVLDIIPTGQTGQAAVVYMEETTRTHAAAEKAEGGTYAESTFALTEQSSTVRKITDSVPVTDEQLEDVAQAESYLNGRLTIGLRQKLDGQILVGDGIAPNLLGILNGASIQTQAKGTDPVPDAVYKAMTKLRVTGRVIPTHVIMHPNDWQDIRLLRTADGIYIWGSPSEAGIERIWGLPVVQSDAETENTGLVGSFTPAWVMLFERRGIEVEVGYTGTQFVEGKKTIRGSLRAAFVMFRQAAFCTVTGI